MEILKKIVQGFGGKGVLELVSLVSIHLVSFFWEWGPIFQTTGTEPYIEANAFFALALNRDFVIKVWQKLFGFLKIIDS